MNDTIYRQDAIDALAKWFYDVFGITESVGTATIFKRLRELPSAQPQRKKGEWIKISPANIYECSECGKNVMTDDISAYDFCHGCGVDMRGESDE